MNSTQATTLSSTVSFYSYDYETTNYNLTTYGFSNYTYPTNDSLIDPNKFILPVWRQILWSILYAGMVLVATGGNLIVIWIVLAHKRMRTVTNYFLLNLSVADTMVSTLNVTFNYVYMLNSHWPFGRLYCKISQFIAILSICASVFSLMAISIDRSLRIRSHPIGGSTYSLCCLLIKRALIANIRTGAKMLLLGGTGQCEKGLDMNRLLSCLVDMYF